MTDDLRLTEEEIRLLPIKGLREDNMDAYLELWQAQYDKIMKPLSDEELREEIAKIITLAVNDAFPSSTQNYEAWLPEADQILQLFEAKTETLKETTAGQLGIIKLLEDKVRELEDKVGELEDKVRELKDKVRELEAKNKEAVKAERERVLVEIKGKMFTDRWRKSSRNI